MMDEANTESSIHPNITGTITISSPFSPQNSKQKTPSKDHMHSLTSPQAKVSAITELPSPIIVSEEISSNIPILKIPSIAHNSKEIFVTTEFAYHQLPGSDNTISTTQISEVTKPIITSEDHNIVSHSKIFHPELDLPPLGNEILSKCATDRNPRHFCFNDEISDVIQ